VLLASRLRKLFVTILAIASTAAADRSLADALVVTQAMKATTIAEIFVEQNAIRVEVEIGAEDLQAFRNILPDEIYQRLGNEPAPLAERSRRFFQQDFTFSPYEFGPLPSRIARLEPRTRMSRDEITGEPLPAQSGEQETVVFAELVYSLDAQPDSLLIKPPSGEDDTKSTANIGFAAYHLGLPVNDFRYLASEEKLELDWEDPWYSFFHNRNLGRRYNAPASAFLYVENFEVRKEIIIRPRDLQDWIDLGLAGETTIPAQRQTEVTQRAAEFLMDRGKVKIDGQLVEPTLDRIHFVRQSLRRTSIVEPDEDLDVSSAMLGVIFIYRTDALPRNVAMTWDLFGHKIKELPTMAVDEAGAMPFTLTSDDPVLRWHNFLTNPTIPAFMAVPPPRQPRRIPIPTALLICLVAICAIWFRRLRMERASRGPRRGAVVISAVLLAIAVMVVPWTSPKIVLPGTAKPMIADEDATEVTRSLLHNVYRAFDYRDESTIYDVLHRSVSGDLLATVYLDMRRSLTLADQGGARVKVTEVTLADCKSKPIEIGTGFLATCVWHVDGSVGHWGHLHKRRNRYHAKFMVRPIDGQWKIHHMQLLAEERLF
jgi:hypothetical protein